jgi:alcohol dehydrogenase
LQVCDNHFQPGFTAWGSFAQRVAIPHADLNLVRLPDSLSYVDAASLGCRFVTSYRAIVQQGQLTADQWLAVHGCGGVGLAAIMIGRAIGARIVAVDVNPAALERARELGAEHLVAGNDSRPIVRQIRDITEGGAHVSIDAVGGHTTCLQSIHSLRKQGCHVQVGLMVGSDAHTPLPMHAVIAKELRIIGSHGMAAASYGPLLDWISQGILEPSRLVSQRVPLEAIPDLLPLMPQNRHVGMTVMECNDSLNDPRAGA